MLIIQLVTCNHHLHEASTWRQVIANQRDEWQQTNLCHYRVTQEVPDPLGPLGPLGRTASLAWMVVTATLESLVPLVSSVQQVPQDPLGPQAPWDQQDPRVKE